MIIMKPDFELEAKEQAEEDARLEKLNASLTPADVDLINKEAKALKKAQKELGPKDCLPTVSLEDVPQTVKSFPLEMRNFNHLKVAEHEVFTNGLVYADLIYDLPAIPLSDIHYLRLLMAIITQVGAGGKSYEDTLNEIQSSTGGIYISLGMNPQATHPDLIRPSIHIKGKSLNTKAKTLFSLIKDFATKPGLNEKDRIEEVISKQRSQLESAFNANAMRYAKSLSSASLRTGCQLYDWCFGMSYTDFLTNLKEIPFEKFEQLFEHIFHYRSPELVIGGERSILTQLEKERYFGLIDLKDNGRAIPDWNIPLKAQPSQGRVISSSVAFISHSFKTVPYVHPDTPILALASNLMDSLFLHPLIREEGGAYGGGSSSIGNEGYFQLSSYRDPHVKSTLDAFKFAIHELAKGEFTDSDLTEAKFEFVQTLDQPVRPANRAEIAYMWLREGRTDQIRETNRKRALKATRTDIIEAVQKHLIPGFDQGVTVAIGSKKLLNQLPDLEIITPPPKQTS
jgi:Zn-dependent M16 (insulinase) family peptidase